LDFSLVKEQPKQYWVATLPMASQLDEILEQAFKLAKPFEGLSLKAYYDPVGYPTQGYGRLLSREVWGNLGQPPKNREERQRAQEWLENKYPTVDLETADVWLKEDMLKATRATLRLCPGATGVKQIAALADFTFNCGAGNLEISTLRRRVNRGDFVGASDEFLKWVFARGIKLPGLVRRRVAERDLFLS
jgi:lysozyme